MNTLFTEEQLAHLSPMDWEHINLTRGLCLGFDREKPTRSSGFAYTFQALIADLKTRWLVFVRLVDKSQGRATEPLAAHKPQLRLLRPLWEEPPSSSHDVGHH